MRITRTLLTAVLLAAGVGACGRPSASPAEIAAQIRTRVESFAAHDSASVQHTMYAMGNAVLAEVPDVAVIHLVMPNKHHLPVDLSRFGLENRNEIFVATDEPHGLIEATIAR